MSGTTYLLYEREGIDMRIVIEQKEYIKDRYNHDLKERYIYECDSDEMSASELLGQMHGLMLAMTYQNNSILGAMEDILQEHGYYKEGE